MNPANCRELDDAIRYMETEELETFLSNDPFLRANPRYIAANRTCEKTGDATENMENFHDDGRGWWLVAGGVVLVLIAIWGLGL